MILASAPMAAAPAASQPPWMGGNTNGFGAGNHTQTSQNNTFVSESNFSNVFGNADPSGMVLYVLFGSKIFFVDIIQ